MSGAFSYQQCRDEDGTEIESTIGNKESDYNPESPPSVKSQSASGDRNSRSKETQINNDKLNAQGDSLSMQHIPTNAYLVTTLIPWTLNDLTPSIQGIFGDSGHVLNITILTDGSWFAVGYRFRDGSTSPNVCPISNHINDDQSFREGRAETDQASCARSPIPRGRWKRQDELLLSTYMQQEKSWSWIAQKLNRPVRNVQKHWNSMRNKLRRGVSKQSLQQPWKH